MARPVIRLRVNGIERETAADAQTPLLFVLRNDLGLKAARFGCGNEQCGACDVMLDGRAVAACTLPVSAAEGHAITTVEGLGDEAHPHALQRALLEEQAAQCGYCLSGILIRAAALLRDNPNPDETAVRQALDRHLCRCGSHNRIVSAVLRAAQALRAAKP
ncbi:MAG: (2Fe-2S)-binding protein [Bacillota bacterium]